MEHWAAGEFAGSVLPNDRFRPGLVRNAEALVSDTGASFSVACGDDGRQAARRLFRHAKTSMKGLMKGHVQQTAARCSGLPLVIVAQDTVTLEYTGHSSLTGLGPITSGSRARGLFMHSALAMSPDGQPLGCLHCEVWAREDRDIPKRNSRHELPISEKESCKWINGLRATAKAIPPGQEVVVVGDRESDIFDLFAARRRKDVQILVRARHARRVQPDPDDDEAIAITTLTLAVEAAPIVGELVVQVPRKPGQPTREAKLTVQYRGMCLLPPTCGVRSKSVTPQKVAVVRVAEVSPPDGVEPIKWILLTTMPVSTPEAACEIVRYYTLRWTIERLHFTLKSGCFNVEHVQIDNGTALTNALALYYITAWRVLYLTYLARTTPEAPADTVLTDDELSVLQASAKRPIHTIAEAVRQIAILAGHPRWNNTPPPGVKRMCRGLLLLGAMVAGWQLGCQPRHVNQD
jgi:hypothetical protein